MILHKLNKSPFESTSLKQCLQRAASKDKILLCSDAVYACRDQEILPKLKALSPIYCLSDDVLARGLQLDNTVFSAIDYKEFVQLSLECNQVISW
ncbi:sulfurtransferase complex subunit TusB [Paraglaciecola sp.]|uniref:sulfurtransferase complex subunit TusB n=1 Tax=Paraglaciecola sp. TaxID=1920173 RepID=UPI003EFA47E4